MVEAPMVRITGQRRPGRGTIRRSGAHRDYRASTYESKPHKVRYYLERRDPLFDEKMAEVLCVYREVALLKQSAVAQEPETPAIGIISYDEKPGVQAIGTTAPDLPPPPLRHDCLARDHEYVRHGTLSLLAGIDLLTGVVHASMEERHRSREFVGFLQKLDAAYPSSTAIKLILDNDSAHISKETKAAPQKSKNSPISTRPGGRRGSGQGNAATPRRSRFLKSAHRRLFSLMRRTLIGRISDNKIAAPRRAMEI